jgi:hypothetical protein
MPTIAQMLAYQVFGLLDETFEHHHGIYLDKGTSLFETLDTISAEEASRPVSVTCASIAAQVEHTRFYIEVMEDVLSGNDHGNWDWGDIWRRVQVVTPEEWDASKQNLRETYQRVFKRIQSLEPWEGENDLGVAVAILAHSAFHLGQIRQALCTVQSR